MLKFNPQDYKQLAALFKQYNNHDFNSNICSWIMWDHVYELYMEIHENYTLLLIHMHDTWEWLTPLCDERYRHEAMDAMQRYSYEHHFPFVLCEVLDDFKRWCQQAHYPFVYQRERERDDYVYDIAQHRDLTGKKMQKRRNHYNAFIKENGSDYSFEPLAPSQFDELYVFLDTWKNNHSHIQDIENELIGIRRMLANFDQLPLLGGILRIHGQIEGFILASPIDDELIQIHVEKVNHEYRGLSVAILKCFLETLPAAYTKMDREDDLGLPELRKAKLDMHPIYRIKRFRILPGKAEIVPANDNLLPQIKNLWLNSFPDENPLTTAFYFDKLYDPKQTQCLLHDDQLVCMLHLRDMELMMDGKVTAAKLILGIATDPEYQECGYMRQLLTHVLDKNTQTPLLIQAYDWELYKPFGFETSYKRRKTILRKAAYEGLEKQCDCCEDAAALLSLYNEYVQDKNGYRIRDLSYYQDYLIPYAKCSGRILIHRSQDEIDGYLVYDESEDQLIVNELICRSQKTANAMMCCICDSDKEIIVYHVDDEIVGDTIEEPSMMSLHLPIHENNFISESL